MKAVKLFLDLFGDEQIDRLAEEILALVSKQLLCLRVDKNDLAVLIGNDNGIGSKFDQLLKALSGRNQAVDQAALDTHITGDGQHAGNLVLLVVHEAEREADRDQESACRWKVDFEVGQLAVGSHLHQFPGSGRNRFRVADGGEWSTNERGLRAFKQCRRRRIGPDNAS